jgi:ribonuclease P protein component
MPEKRFTFSKGERLCSKKTISQLFEREGTLRVSEYPLALVWKTAEHNSDFPAQVVFSISRKYTRKSVSRNRIRRQMRELYRLKKHLIYNALEEKKLKVAIMISYTGPEKMEFAELAIKFERLIEKVIKNID